MQSDDLDIDDLILLTSKPKCHVEKSPIQAQGYSPVEYEQVPATIYCMGCNTQYEGSMTKVKGMDNLYDRYKLPYCPNCIAEHKKEWWQTCFRMEVLNTKKIEI